MAPVEIPRRAAEIGIYGLFLLFAIAAFRHTDTFPAPLLRGYPGAAMFPRLVLAAMAAFCLLGLARAALQRGPAGATVALPLGAFGAALAIVCAFVAALAALGMEVAVFALIAGSMWRRTGRPALSAAIAILSVAIVYLLFVQALSVHLPLTALPRYPGIF